MGSSRLTHAQAPGLRRSLLSLLVASLSVGPVQVASAAPPAVPAPPTTVIVLPGATSTEGIAVGSGSTVYAGDLFRGDIYRGNLQRGTAELFIDAPAGRMAT